ERAQELAPNQPETEIAVGMSLYWSETDNERTLSYFQTILQRFPNQTILHLYIALTHRRLGNWESVIEHLNNALELDPLNSNHYLELTWNFWMMRDYDEAQATLDELRELKPNTSIPFSFDYNISISRDGTLDIFEEYWNRLRPADLAVEEPLLWGYYNYLKRNWKEANRGYKNSDYETFRNDEARYLLTDFFIGLTYDRMGNQAEANRYYEVAREHLEKLTDEHPNEPRYRTALGRVYARLGMDEKAIHEGERATELTPFSQNANAGSYFEFQLAEIYAWTGHEEKAIDKLEFALSVPSHAHRNWIALHPRWDPLRDNPRFQALIAGEDEPYLKDL
ncbi:MAG: hypothetical protein R3220_04030, partial [Balneolaceae bacterium]|nr:hypothetical protein [Balneolaceae bacterium]